MINSSVGGMKTGETYHQIFEDRILKGKAQIRKISEKASNNQSDKNHGHHLTHRTL